MLSAHYTQWAITTIQNCRDTVQEASVRYTMRVQGTLEEARREEEQTRHLHSSEDHYRQRALEDSRYRARTIKETAVTISGDMTRDYERDERIRDDSSAGRANALEQELEQLNGRRGQLQKWTAADRHEEEEREAKVEVEHYTRLESRRAKDRERAEMDVAKRWGQMEVPDSSPIENDTRKEHEQPEDVVPNENRGKNLKERLMSALPSVFTSPAKRTTALPSVGSLAETGTANEESHITRDPADARWREEQQESWARHRAGWSEAHLGDESAQEKRYVDWLQEERQRQPVVERRQEAPKGERGDISADPALCERLQGAEAALTSTLRVRDEPWLAVADKERARKETENRSWLEQVLYTAFCILPFNLFLLLCHFESILHIFKFLLRRRGDGRRKSWSSTTWRRNEEIY
jgi:hypothetical protein